MTQSARPICAGFEQDRDGLAFLVLAIGSYSRELLGLRLSRRGTPRWLNQRLSSPWLPRHGWLGKVVKHPFRQRSDNGLVSASHGRTALVKGYGV